MRDLDKIKERTSLRLEGRQLQLLGGVVIALLVGTFYAGMLLNGPESEEATPSTVSDLSSLKESLKRTTAEEELVQEAPLPTSAKPSQEETKEAKPVGAKKTVAAATPQGKAEVPQADQAEKSTPSTQASPQVVTVEKRPAEEPQIIRVERKQLDYRLPVVGARQLRETESAEQIRRPAEPTPTMVVAAPKAPVKQTKFIPAPMPAGGPASSAEPTPDEISKTRQGRHPRKRRGDRVKARTSNGNDFTLQVRAFRTEEDAAQLGEELGANGYDAYVVKSTIPDKGVWYRVRIGQFGSLKDATDFQVFFEEAEGISTFVSPL